MDINRWSPESNTLVDKKRRVRGGKAGLGQIILSSVSPGESGTPGSPAARKYALNGAPSIKNPTSNLLPGKPKSKTVLNRTTGRRHSPPFRPTKKEKEEYIFSLEY